MPYPMADMTQMMGIGSYVGEIRQGPDGQLYEWVEGVDGLGNPIGFWKGIKTLVSKALPLTKFIPGIGPVIHQVRGAVKGLCQALPQLGPVIQQVPDVRPVYQAGTKICNVLRKVGLAGVEGGLMQAPDGQLYEVVEGVGAFGEPQPVLRRVWLSIPPVVRPRGLRRGVGPGIPRPQIVPAGVRPPVPTAVPGVRPPIPTPGVRAFRRFR